MKYISLLVIVFFMLSLLGCKAEKKETAPAKPVIPSQSVDEKGRLSADTKDNNLILESSSTERFVPRGYKIADVVGVDFDDDNVMEYAVFAEKTATNKSSRASISKLYIEKNGEISWESNDDLSLDCKVSAQSLTNRDQYELVVHDPVGGSADFFNVFIYGYEKDRSGKDIFGRLWRFHGSSRAGDSVVINGDNIISISSVSKDGDIYSNEATRFIATYWTWKENGFTKIKTEMTKKRYSPNSDNPNGFYKEFGITSGLVTKKPFKEPEKTSK